MGDENPIRTLGDYSKPSHEGYRNTIELPVGNNVCEIDRVTSGKLLNKNTDESWEIIENLVLYEHEGWDETKKIIKPVKAISTPQGVLKAPDQRLLELEDQINFLLKRIMNPQETQQVAARDEKWVPSAKRVKISSTNIRLEITVPQKEETFQVVIDIIKNSTCSKAFTISADVPKIFMHQFWYTVKKVPDTNSYEFLLANKKCIINAEVFRTILNICPRVEGEDFTDDPDDDTALTFLNNLSYKGPLNRHTNMFMDHMHQPWRTLAAIINKCLSGKTANNDKLRKSRIDILWGIFNRENVDYPKLIWEDFAYQIDHRKEKRSRLKDATGKYPNKGFNWFDVDGGVVILESKRIDHDEGVSVLVMGEVVLSTIFEDCKCLVYFPPNGLTLILATLEVLGLGLLEMSLVRMIVMNNERGCIYSDERFNLEEWTFNDQNQENICEFRETVAKSRECLVKKKEKILFYPCYTREVPLNRGLSL
ncbi:hypothetical protein Tco_0494754 [Tanacetum coccineum]